MSQQIPEGIAHQKGSMYGRLRLQRDADTEQYQAVFQDVVKEHLGGGEVPMTAAPAATQPRALPDPERAASSQPSSPTTAESKTAWMEAQRTYVKAYEYLCRMCEAKEWVEACVGEKFGSVTEFESQLPYGIILAKLARYFQPSQVRRIYEGKELQLRHSDNTMMFLRACKNVEFPEVYLFTITDVYERKNIPKVVSCLHALAHYLHGKGMGPPINNLIGTLIFDKEDLAKVDKDLDGLAMPDFPAEAAPPPPPEPEEPPEVKRARFLEENVPKIITVQSVIRMHLAKKKLGALKQRRALWKSKQWTFITPLQAHCRGYLVRLRHKAKHWAYEKGKVKIVAFQTRIRGLLVRKKYQADKAYWAANVDKVVKVQSYIKAKKMGAAYRMLSNPDSITVKIIQQFAHLLADGDRDFLQERQLQELKSKIARKLRENNQSEQQLNEMDIKIALLVRNRLTLDEVVKTSSRMLKKKHEQQMLEQFKKESSGQSPNDLFAKGNLKSLDKESRQRLELYQNLFYILQTQSKYLAQIVLKVKPSKIRSFMDHILLPMYNFANSNRDEFMLMKLFQSITKEDMRYLNDPQELIKGDPLFMRICVHYSRGARERQYLRDVLQPLIKAVVDNVEMELELDPLVIYRQTIRNEESRTGESSKRPYDVTRDRAAADSETAPIFAERQAKLRQQVDSFLTAMENGVANMPYGLRFIAKQMSSELRAKFPVKSQDDEERIWKIVGNLVYYRYMNPAIVAPEAFDVIEQMVSPMQRKNLAEIAKLLQNISMGRMFENDLAHLAPLNPYIFDTSKRMFAYFKKVTEVSNAEDFFQTTLINDLTSTHKPVIYITPEEIFNTHQLTADSMNDMSASLEVNDLLKQLLLDIGPVPKSAVTENYYSRVGQEGAQDEPSAKSGGGGAGPVGGLRGDEISLTLVSRYVENFNTKEAGALSVEMATDYRNTFIEVKKLVLLLIRSVNQGNTLPEILSSETSEEDESLYQQVRLAELQLAADAAALLAGDQAQPAAAAAPGQKQDDVPLTESLAHLSADVASHLPEHLSDVKGQVKKLLNKLETLYRAISQNLPDTKKLRDIGIIEVTQTNLYQDVLTSIGADITDKHRRRKERQQELVNIKRTAENLDAKSAYLEEQRQSYQDYINGCMAQLTSQQKQARFVMPLSSQWSHIQQLKKQGKVPQFGSFKFRADALHQKGVLISVEGYTPKQFDKVSLTISSDQLGVFNVAVTILGVPLPLREEVKLEDLLNYQFENKQVMTLFGGAAKVNVNLLIYLINKKFYH